MPITFDTSRTAPKGTEVLGVPVATSGPVPRSLGLNRSALEALGFEGKVGQAVALPARNGALIVAVGIGDPGTATTATLRTAAAALARVASKRSWVATSLVDVDGIDARDAAQAVAEGVVLASYRYTALKSDQNGVSKLERVTLLGADAGKATAGAERGAVVARATCLARDLANMPPNHLAAKDLADRAEDLGKAAGLKVEVLDEIDIAELGLGGLLGVNQGSVEPPRLVKLTYEPRNPRGTVALVGKGVMFDSGGLTLKPNTPMTATMKLDMTGAAVVLATLTALAAIKPKVKVIGYLACTDNMPSGSAVKYGDVLRIRNGTTVEVLNTDAEGRLILADALCLAVEDGADAIVDVATLTGSALAALGEKIAGVMGNHDGWIAQVEAAAKRTDEQVWRLPLPPEYRKQLDSEVADLKNVGGQYGGALVAGLFLQEFVSGKPWAHLDIAGTMRSESDDGWLSRGATGFGVRLLLDLLERAELPTPAPAG